VISAQAISRRFGRTVAVDRVSFEVGKGEVLGFIGPNGAGKTTTMRMLTGFLPVTEGRAVVAGFDVFEEPMEVRRRVGYLPERPPLYTELTIGAYLSFVAEIRGIPSRDRARRIGEVMDQVGLVGWEQRLLGSLSKGYRQRVGLAQAVLHDPEVLILDEPTSGLDPSQVAGMRDYVRGLAQQRTVILSTHILPEVERLCRRAVVIHRGRVAADDTLDGLKARVGQGVRFRIELRGGPEDHPRLPQMIGALGGVDQVSPLGEADGFWQLDVRAPEDPRTAVARLASERGWLVRAMERHTPSLEEAFLAITGQEHH
jgi:ABC-2 type transport system ATP-binding protein